MAGPHAGPSKKHSLVRSRLNKDRKKYEKQRIRTERNKARRRAAHQLRNPNDKQ